MTNQEIALEITKILKPDVDHYTRNHNDGTGSRQESASMPRLIFIFSTNSTRTTKPKAKQRKNKKQGVHKTASIPAGMSAGTFLRISKPHDAINGAEDWI